MGYINCFYLVDKEEVEKIRDLSYEELLEYSKEHYPEALEKYVYDDGEVEIYFNFLKILSQEEIHNFGKLYSCNIASRIYSKGEPLFRNEYTQEYFKEYTPYLVGKEGILEASKCYRDKVLRYYTKFLKKVCKEEENKIAKPFTDTPKKFIKRKSLKWKFRKTFSTLLQRDFFTDSYQSCHELADVVFNLLHLLKTIDWDKKALLFYGH